MNTPQERWLPITTFLESERFQYYKDSERYFSNDNKEEEDKAILKEALIRELLIPTVKQLEQKSREMINEDVLKVLQKMYDDAHEWLLLDNSMEARRTIQEAIRRMKISFAKENSQVDQSKTKTECTHSLSLRISWQCDICGFIDPNYMMTEHWVIHRSENW